MIPFAGQRFFGEEITKRLPSNRQYFDFDPFGDYDLIFGATVES
jgi:hypothetical protein